jgi:hypothetical protein
MYTSEKRLYLADDGKTVVEEGNPRAATLLVGAGGQLSDEDARRYGLTEKTEAKAKAAPPENKAHQQRETKDQ